MLAAATIFIVASCSAALKDCQVKKCYAIHIHTAISWSSSSRIGTHFNSSCRMVLSPCRDV